MCRSGSSIRCSCAGQRPAPTLELNVANTDKTAILLLAHGSPESVDGIPDFLRGVTGARPVPSRVIDEVKHRSALIGHSPLQAITFRHGELLADRLALPAYVGMRNWKPHILDVLRPTPQERP